VADGLLQAGFADANFRCSNYIRLKVLSELRARGDISPDLYWTTQ
jgi:hypothetical protein